MPNGSTLWPYYAASGSAPTEEADAGETSEVAPADEATEEESEEAPAPTEEATAGADEEAPTPVAPTAEETAAPVANRADEIKALQAKIKRYNDALNGWAARRGENAAMNRRGYEQQMKISEALTRAEKRLDELTGKSSIVSTVGRDGQRGGIAFSSLPIPEIRRRQAAQFRDKDGNTYDTRYSKFLGRPISAALDGLLDRLNHGEWWDGVQADIEATPEWQEAMARRREIEAALPDANGNLGGAGETRYLPATPERTALQEKIALDQLAPVVPDPKRKGETYTVAREKKIWIITGLPSAGKSSVFADRICSENHARLVDSDEVKKSLPEFNDGFGANAVHEESKEILDRVFDKALARGENIVHPILGKSAAKLEKIISDCNSAGYQVYIDLNEVPPAVSMARLVQRFLDQGRFLPLECVIGGGTKPTEAFHEIKRHYRTDAAEEAAHTISGVSGLSDEAIRLGRHGASDETGRENAGISGVSGLAPGLTRPVLSGYERRSNDVGFGEEPVLLEKDGQEFRSSLSSRVSAEEDAAYMDAVKRGDMETAHQNAIDAARSQFRNPSPEVFHGSGAFGFTKFGGDVIFTSARVGVANGYNKADVLFHSLLRPISSRDIDTSTPEAVAKSLNAMTGEAWHVMTNEEKARLFDEVSGKALAFYKKVVAESETHPGWEENLPQDAAGEYYSQEGDAEGVNHDLLSDIWTVLSAFQWADNIGAGGAEVFNGETDIDAPGHRAMLETEQFSHKYYQEYRETVKNLRDYYSRNWDEIKARGLEWVFNLIGSGERTDLAVDSSVVADTLNPDGFMLTTTDGGNHWNGEDAKNFVETYRTNGTYRLIGELGDKPLYLDADGAFWTSIRVDAWDGKTHSTDSIVKWAKENGYTSVVIRNVIDPARASAGIPSDDYVFFGKNNVKSTDPVTYDDAGNVIPLSERFNRQKDDIRYSVRSAKGNSKKYARVDWAFAFAARDVMQGIQRPDEEYQKLIDSLKVGGDKGISVDNLRAFAGRIENAYRSRTVEAGKRTFNDAVPLSALAAASASSRLDTILSTILSSAWRQGLDRGLFVGESAEKAVMTALTARMRAARGYDAMALDEMLRAPATEFLLQIHETTFSNAREPGKPWKTEFDKIREEVSAEDQELMDIAANIDPEEEGADALTKALAKIKDDRARVAAGVVIDMGPEAGAQVDGLWHPTRQPKSPVTRAPSPANTCGNSSANCETLPSG